METILSINKLSKSYGPLKAVSELELIIPKGSVYGLLGPNGSGKTTTLGMLLDVIKPDQGEYTWFNGGPKHKNLKRVGAILENPNFYPYLSALDNLKIVALIKNVGDADFEDKLRLVNLWDRANDKFKTYSLGMKQRLAIAAALISDPEVMLLDEPTNGLDPKGIAEVRELVTKIALRGITIIMASHILDEVEKVCSHVAVLKRGKLLASGKVNEVVSGDKWFEVSSSKLNQLKAELETWNEVTKIVEEENALKVWCTAEMDSEMLNKKLSLKGISLSRLVSKSKSLESYFLELTA